MVQLNFNANDVAPQGSFTVFESGVYDVMINGSEMKQTKAKAAGQAQKGAYLQLNLKIVSGPNANGTIIDRVNIENDNPTAEEIGQAQLSAICRVTGVMQLQDSQQLHGIPFKVELAKTERNDKPGTFSNEVKGYQDAHGNPPEKAGQGSGQAAPPPAAQQQPAPPVQSAPQPQTQQATTPPAQTQQQPWQQPPAQQPPAQQPPAEQPPAQQPPAQQPPAQQEQQPPAQQPAGSPPPWAQQQG